MVLRNQKNVFASLGFTNGGKELLNLSQNNTLLLLNTTYTRIPFLRLVTTRKATLGALTSAVVGWAGGTEKHKKYYSQPFMMCPIQRSARPFPESTELVWQVFATRSEALQRGTKPGRRFVLGVERACLDVLGPLLAVLDPKAAAEIEASGCGDSKALHL